MAPVIVVAGSPAGPSAAMFPATNDRKTHVFGTDDA